MNYQSTSHAEIARFAREQVNLSQEKANEHRAQANRLTSILNQHIMENPHFELRRLVMSGSLAKGTALKDLNDIDVACYIKWIRYQQDIPTLIGFLIEKLGRAFPNFSRDQIKPNRYSVTVAFKGSGLDVDIVPVIYDGNKLWNGNLINQKDGSFLMTNIPQHIEFIRKRKSRQKIHFGQVIRLIKYWISKQKEEDHNFRFKSFIAELILAKLVDGGLQCSDYSLALKSFFSYLVNTRLLEQIAFTDFYPASEVAMQYYKGPIKIIDPVNVKNNAAEDYSWQDANRIVGAAREALGFINPAIYSTNRQIVIQHLQKLFGPTFKTSLFDK